MSRHVRLLTLTTLVFAFAATLSATTFVIPDDAKFIAKANAIVVGTVEGSYVTTDAGDFPIGTVYEVRLQRVLKGDFQADDLVRIVAPGGESGKFSLYVAGAPSFSNGQKVLLFLTHHKDHWEATDLMLGEFSFMTSPAGARVLVRGDDTVDNHGTGRVHAVDKIRSEDEFLDYIGKVLAGHPAAANYYPEPDKISLPPTPQPTPFRHAIMTAYTAASYTQVGSGTQGVRWPTATIASELDYARHTGCTGCDPTNADSFITNGMAAWNNDCASTVNLVLTGTTSTAALAGVPDCGGFCDFKNVIEFGDPQGKISGSWTGSGLIAVTTITSFTADDGAGAGFHQIADADIIFQDGYLPNSETSAPQATTHELGHSIGWRHSQANPSTPNGQTETCNPSTAECSDTAIMFWQVNSLGYTLQTWDQDAIRAVYPGGACTVPAAPTNVTATATSSTSIDISWTASASGSTPITYQVQRSSTGTAGFANLGSPTSGTTATDTLGSSTAAAFLYRVVASNSAGSATSSYDLATNVIFTDTTLTGGTTPPKTTHITELRTAVDAVRKLANGGVANPFSYTDSTLTGGTTPIKKVHITDLRTALDAARSTLALTALSYTDPTITVNSTPVKAVHITELRNGVK
jgi:hypothetical protein